MNNTLKHTLRSVARRSLAFDEETSALQDMIGQLVEKHSPQLPDKFGIDFDPAQILIVADDNPDRPCSEAAFARLSGISPVPAGSGRTFGRHRINYGGHLQLNVVINRAVTVRMQHHKPATDYIARTHRRRQKQTRRHPRGLPDDQN